MVKPGITSIDLIKEIKKTKLPTGAYQVSGEYASLQYLSKNKLGDFDKLYKESLTAIHRAGADFIITYGARDIAKKFIIKNFIMHLTASSKKYLLFG